MPMISFEDLVNSAIGRTSIDAPRLFVRVPYSIERRPRVGDMMRSDQNWNFINVVLEVSDVKYEDKPTIPNIRSGPIPFVWIRSVRLLYTSKESSNSLEGNRSRAFKYYFMAYKNKWHIVQEVKVSPVDNSAECRAAVERLKDVDTAWRPEEPAAE